MKILICGINGLIGQTLAARLAALGHEVWGGVRHSSSALNAPVYPEIICDYLLDTSAEVWRARVRGFDVVVNAVGVLANADLATFEKVHHLTPCALFDACVAEGVARVIQISAHGAPGISPFVDSKYRADSYLQNLNLDYAIVRPSLVFSPEGASTQLFLKLAMLPVLLLPNACNREVQPIALDDLASLLVGLVEVKNIESFGVGRLIHAVGASTMSFHHLLETYRAQLGFSSRMIHVPIPYSFALLGAKIAQYLPHALIAPDTLKLLQANEVVSSEATQKILQSQYQTPHQTLTSAHDFLTKKEGDHIAQRNLLNIGNGLLRLSLAIVWIITALVSAFFAPPGMNESLLRPLGLVGKSADVAVWLGSGLDLMFGVLTIFVNRAWIWAAQLCLVGGYTVICTFFLFDQWLHPFGPILKNIPILAALVWLWLCGLRNSSYKD